MTHYDNSAALWPYLSGGVDGTRHAEVFEITLADAVEAITNNHDSVPDDFDGEPADLVGYYWRTCLPGCMPDSSPRGPFANHRAALDASRGLDPYERDHIEAVFTLGGGELEDEPMAWTEGDNQHRVIWWYEGAPHYAGDHPDIPRDCGGFHTDNNGKGWEYRTLVVCELWGKRSLPEGWERVTSFRSSGETACPWCGDGTGNEEHREGCECCEGDGIVYLGAGWSEVVIRRHDPEMDNEDDGPQPWDDVYDPANDGTEGACG